MKLLFAENSGVVFQTLNAAAVEEVLKNAKVEFHIIGEAKEGASLEVKNGNENLSFNIAQLRDVWYETSFLLDQKQSGVKKATERFNNYKNQALQFNFLPSFTGKKPVVDAKSVRPKAAVIREKGSNSEREMANALFLAGFDVKDVHMTDLQSGRVSLNDFKGLVACGGFSYGDTLGAGIGWARSITFNAKLSDEFKAYFARKDTFGLGVCNGCQMMSNIKEIIPGADLCLKFIKNDLVEQ